MKHGKISLRRRQLMIAGMAGAAAPATLYAAGTGGPLAAEFAAAGGTTTEDMVVSGRIVGADGRPLFNATVELWPAGAASRVSVATDGDGRFFTPVAGAGRRQIHYRVHHKGQETRELRLNPARRDARAQRDEAGVWRTTFGVALA